MILYETENDLFDSLPQEFKYEYKSLRELCTKEFLYQYGFEASIDAKKLEKALNSHSIEFGETSSGRVIRRVNEYLHFLLGNGVCLDVYTEYKSSVCTLMEKLIQKYTDQQRKSLRDFSLFDVTDSKIHFDQHDFYCFIRFFKASELEKVLKDNNLKTIVFNNMDSIEIAIHNMIMYAEKVIREGKTLVEVNGLLSETATFLVLARYMRLSEEMFEEICQFIFKYNLKDITIEQKILFLNSQVLSGHIGNKNIQKVLEAALIKYIEARLVAISNGKEWVSISKQSGINYPNIADYMYIDKKGIISRRLSKMVSIIIDRQIVPMQRECVEHYYNHVSKAQRKRITKWIEDRLINDFEFERFALLVQINAKTAKKYSDNLFCLVESIEKETKSEERGRAQFYPKTNPHSELINVGYWCFCGLLDPIKFMMFKGIDLEFDFLIDAINFDYTQFNVGWLLEMNRHALGAVTQKATVRNKILKVIIQEIKKDELKQDEKERLIKILGDYFAN